MELRTILLILAGVAGVTSLGAGPVKRYPLDDRPVYTVSVGTSAPTTVIFPGPVTALDGAGVSTKPAEEPPILISHQDGARFFSVRALRPGAAGAVNVVFRDRVFAFAFTSNGEPDRTVTFYDSAGDPLRKVPRPGPERLLALIDQAKNYAAIAEQYPALVQRIERTTPGTETLSGSVAAVIEEAFRFDEKDALVFRVRLENRGTELRRYSPAHLGVRVAGVTFPVALTDAPGAVPAGRSTLITLVIVGSPEGGRGHLSLKNGFSIVVPPAE